MRVLIKTRLTTAHGCDPLGSHMMNTGGIETPVMLKKLV